MEKLEIRHVMFFFSQALEDLGACREIEIPNYNEEEFRAMLAFYQDKRWLTKGEILDFCR